MKDFTQSALRALRVYLERGEQAIKELGAGKFDDAKLTLRWRSAAFHNFRVMDHLALAQGQDFGLEQSFHEVWGKIESLDERLEALLEEAQEDAANSLSRIRKSRSKIRHYRSGNQEKPNFAKTV